MGKTIVELCYEVMRTHPNIGKLLLSQAAKYGLSGHPGMMDNTYGSIKAMIYHNIPLIGDELNKIYTHLHTNSDLSNYPDIPLITFQEVINRDLPTEYGAVWESEVNKQGYQRIKVAGRGSVLEAINNISWTNTKSQTFWNHLYSYYNNPSTSLANAVIRLYGEHYNETMTTLLKVDGGCPKCGSTDYGEVEDGGWKKKVCQTCFNIEIIQD